MLPRDSLHHRSAREGKSYRPGHVASEAGVRAGRAEQPAAVHSLLRELDGVPSASEPRMPRREARLRGFLGRVLAFGLPEHAVHAPACDLGHGDRHRRGGDGLAAVRHPVEKEGLLKIIF